MALVLPAPPGDVGINTQDMFGGRDFGPLVDLNLGLRPPPYAGRKHQAIQNKHRAKPLLKEDPPFLARTNVYVFFRVQLCSLFAGKLGFQVQGRGGFPSEGGRREVGTTTEKSDPKRNAAWCFECNGLVDENTDFRTRPVGLGSRFRNGLPDPKQT